MDDSTAIRIDRLERSVRRLRLAALGLALAFGIVVAAGARGSAKVPDVIQARDFEVIGPDGKARADFGMSGAQPRLWIGHKGKGDGTAMELSMDDDGENVGLVVFGRGGKGSAIVQVRDKNRPVVEIDDPGRDNPIKLR